MPSPVRLKYANIFPASPGAGLPGAGQLSAHAGRRAGADSPAARASELPGAAAAVPPRSGPCARYAAAALPCSTAGMFVTQALPCSIAGTVAKAPCRIAGVVAKAPCSIAGDAGSVGHAPP